jgi:hypothetical protein
LNADGTVNSVDYVAADDTGTFGVSANSKYILSVTGATYTNLYSVSSDVVVFDTTGASVDAASWSDLQGSITGTSFTGDVVVNSSGVVVAVKLSAGTIATTDSDKALVVSKFTDADGNKVELNIAGTVVEYALASGFTYNSSTTTAFANVTAGEYVDYTVTGGKLSDVSPANTFVTKTYVVSSFNATSGEINLVNKVDATDTATYFLDKDVVIYTTVDTVEYTTAASISKDKEVEITVSGDYVTVLKITK